MPPEHKQRPYSPLLRDTTEATQIPRSSGRYIGWAGACSGRAHGNRLTDGGWHRRSLAFRMRIAVGADHAGYELKQHVLKFVQESGHEPIDLGTNNTSPVDYPDFAAA